MKFHILIKSLPNKKKHKSRQFPKQTYYHKSKQTLKSFSCFTLIVSSSGAQYILRYRKYHLTISQNDTDSSPLHTPRGSVGSLQMQPSPPSRALSTTTLLSEVIYLVKLRTKTNNVKHSILRESVDAEAAILTKETKFNDPSTKKKTIHSNRYLFLFLLTL